jgi:hypothetical protein
VTLESFVEGEIARRETLWAVIKAAPADAPLATAQGLRSLGIYAGQAGIYKNAIVTKTTQTPQGVAVSLRHNHSSYDDDLSSDGLLYHYPQTNRAIGTDEAEVGSAKAAHSLGIPVFVITGRVGSTNRTVRLGYVESYDDQSSLFLVTFVDEVLKTKPVFPKEDQSEAPFEETQLPSAPILKLVRQRPNQRRFAVDVKKRYGASCAVCSIAIPELIVAAHLVPKNRNGSDDARNGLPLCANHHVALDRGLWRIFPGSNEIVPRQGETLDALRITRSSLTHLPQQPHDTSVLWLWGLGFKAV